MSTEQYNPDTFFAALWQDYIQITPQAEQIKQLFETRDGKVVNDHVAFRTFANTPLELDQLEPLILSLGYTRQESYDFKTKKLRAHSFIHPNLEVPKIFCSELLTDQLSEASQAIIQRYTAQIKQTPLGLSVFWSARHWQTPSFEDYSQLMKETEYGAWLLAMGIRVNHFTISINHLSRTKTIEDVLARVKEAGFAINTTGGEIKGSPATLLEQGSTMADRQDYAFAGGESHKIPTCFYEFALRHPNAEGEIYQGFVEANADKIFESTRSD